MARGRTYWLKVRMNLAQRLNYLRRRLLLSKDCLIQMNHLTV